MPGLSGRSMGLTHFDFKCSLFGKSTEVLCLKIITPHQNICTQCLYTNICTFEHLYTNVHNSIIYNSPEVATIQTPIKWWMDEQNVVYQYTGIKHWHVLTWRSSPGSSVPGISQRRTLEWAAMSSSRRSSDSGIESGSPVSHLGSPDISMHWNTLLFLKTNHELTHVPTWLSLENMLSESSRSQRTTQHVILFI